MLFPPFSILNFTFVKSGDTILIIENLFKK
jgi:hypothetical protein